LKFQQQRRELLWHRLKFQQQRRELVAQVEISAAEVSLFTGGTTGAIFQHNKRTFIGQLFG
jgi:hypothetical protein